MTGRFCLVANFARHVTETAADCGIFEVRFNGGGEGPHATVPRIRPLAEPNF